MRSKMRRTVLQDITNRSRNMEDEKIEKCIDLFEKLEIEPSTQDTKDFDWEKEIAEDPFYAKVYASHLEMMEYQNQKPLKEISVCVSGISNQRRKEIEKLVVENGGIYKRSLNKNCHYLLLDRPQGRKFEFAVKHGIKMFKTQFAEEIVKNNGILHPHEKQALIITAEDRIGGGGPEEPKTVSTGDKRSFAEFNEMIQREGEGNPRTKALDEQNASKESVSDGRKRTKPFKNSKKSTKFDQKPQKLVKLPKGAKSTLTTYSHSGGTAKDETEAKSDPEGLKRASSFSEGVQKLEDLEETLHFSGMVGFFISPNGAIMEESLKSFRKHGGVISPVLDSNVTHVIISPPDSLDLILKETDENKPYVVDKEWIETCVKREKLLDESPFEVKKQPEFPKNGEKNRISGDSPPLEPVPEDFSKEPPGNLLTNRNKQRRIFALSGISGKYKDFLKKQIVELGGEVANKVFDFREKEKNCTHLICAMVSKSTKVVTGIAMGIWILRPSFVQESSRLRGFTDEETHQCGFKKSSPELARRIYLRQKQLRSQRNPPNGSGGVFFGRVFALSKKGSCYEDIRDLILAGGGRFFGVLGSPGPLENGAKGGQCEVKEITDQGEGFSEITDVVVYDQFSASARSGISEAVNFIRPKAIVKEIFGSD